MEKKSNRIVIPETKPEDRESIQEGIEPLTKFEKIINLIALIGFSAGAIIAIILHECGKIQVRCLKFGNY